jgi:hypothetical protein
LIYIDYLQQFKAKGLIFSGIMHGELQQIELALLVNLRLKPHLFDYFELKGGGLRMFGIKNNRSFYIQ